MTQERDIIAVGITKRRALLTGLFCLMPFGSAKSQPFEKPLFSIGAIADCQYADEPDAGKRMYRSASEKLREAVAAFNKLDLAFVVHLGDFIDGDWHSYDTILPIAQASKILCVLCWEITTSRLRTTRSFSSRQNSACRRVITVLRVKVGYSSSSMATM